MGRHGRPFHTSKGNHHDKRAERLPAQPDLVYQGELRDPEALARGGHESGDDHAIPYQVAMEQMGEELFVSMSRFGERVMDFSVSIHLGVPAMRFFEAAESSLDVHVAHGGLVLTPVGRARGFDNAPVDRFSDHDTGSLLARVGVQAEEGMEEQRSTLSDILAERYNFGAEVEPVGMASADPAGGGLLWECRLAPGGQGEPTHMLTVRFLEDTAIPCEVIGYDAAGNRVGSIT